MADGDAFEGAYHRLAGTRLADRSAAPVTPARTGPADPSSPVRRAMSSLLPRLEALAPGRQARRPRRRSED